MKGKVTITSLVTYVSTYAQRLQPYVYTSSTISLESPLISVHGFFDKTTVEMKRRHNLRFHKKTRTWQAYIQAVLHQGKLVWSKKESYSWQPLPQKFQEYLSRQWEQHGRINSLELVVESR